MEVVVNKKLLINVINSLNTALGKLVINNTQGEIGIDLCAEGDQLYIHTLPSAKFVMNVPAQVIESGFVQTTVRLAQIMRVASDEELNLKYNKRIAVSGKSGFKAQVGVLGDDRSAYDYGMQKLNEAGIASRWTLERKRLMDAANLAQTMDSDSIEIVLSADSITASISENVMGVVDSIEALPLEGQHIAGESDELLRFHPHMLAGCLAVLGEDTISLDMINTISRSALLSSSLGWCILPQKPPK